MTTPETQTREARGIVLHRSRGHEIIEVEPGIFRVPSAAGRGFYRVNLDAETCECRDHQHRRVCCLHFFAVVIFAAKRRCRRAAGSPGPRRHAPVQRPAHGAPDTNRDDRRQGSGPSRTKTRRSDSLRGAVPVHVAVAGLNRMAD